MSDLPARDSLGSLLRRYRLAAGLTQEALAERAGLSARGIQNLERGIRAPYPDTLERLIGALRLGGDEQARFREAGRRPLQAVPTQGAASIAIRPRHNLPAPLTSFIGRERDVAEVRRLLEDHRLVTLTGTGGIGKTRLAIEAARELVDVYDDGAWLVELAALSDPTLVPQAVAIALKIQERPARPPLDTLVEALCARHTLLVLDNCEHLIDATAQVAGTLLHGCPHVTVLATSRERLNVDGERTYTVPPLALPPFDQSRQDAEVFLADAVQLFLERAVAAQPAFAMTERNAQQIDHICTQLDGLPLAIELAAALLRVLSLEQLAERLEDRFRLLTGGARTALPRHQTLRATADWSHDLLSPVGRRLLRRLAVFAGGWTLEAAEAVCADPARNGREPAIDGTPVLDVFGSLVDKSLVIVEAADRGEGSQFEPHRYRFLETIRQYAAEKLEAAGEAPEARTRHLAWCVRLAQQAEQALVGPEQLSWLNRLERERDNLRGALTWSERPDGAKADVEAGLRLASALWRFWFMRLRLSETQNALSRLLARANELGDPLRETSDFGIALARALATAGSLAFYWDPDAVGLGYLHDCIVLSRRLGYTPGVAYALNWLAWLKVGDHDYASARGHLEESVALGRTCRDRYLLYEPLYGLGRVLQEQGEFDQAKLRLLESLALCQAAGDRWYAALPLDDLGRHERRLGNYAAARSYIEESLTIWRGFDDRFHEARALMSLGDVELEAADFVAARHNYQQSLALALDVGAKFGSVEAHVRLALVAIEVGDLDASRAHVIETRAFLREDTVARDLGLMALWLTAAACLAVAADQPTRALRLAGAATGLHESMGSPLVPAFTARSHRLLAPARASLGEERAATAWSEGRAMTAEEALEAALAEVAV